MVVYSEITYIGLTYKSDEALLRSEAPTNGGLIKYLKPMPPCIRNIQSTDALV